MRLNGNAIVLDKAGCYLKQKVVDARFNAESSAGCEERKQE